MHQIYLFPTLLGLIVAILIIVVSRRRQRNLLASTLLAAMAGAGAWFVALFATVVLMVSPGAHG